MNYDQWEATVPDEFKGDPIWRVKAYRLARFMGDVVWYDATRVLKDRRTRNEADQIFRATASIGPDISEGYSRSSGKDQARFYEYALGSARESRDRYRNVRHVLKSRITGHRTAMLTEIIRLVTAMIPERRTAPRLSRRANPLRITNSALRAP